MVERNQTALTVRLPEVGDTLPFDVIVGEGWRLRYTFAGNLRYEVERIHDGGAHFGEGPGSAERHFAAILGIPLKILVDAKMAVGDLAWSDLFPSASPGGDRIVQGYQYPRDAGGQDAPGK